MKPFLLSSLVLTLALASTACASDLSPSERVALAAPACTELVSMRAGDEPAIPAVAAAERTQLARAQAASPDLDALRAGEISDHDLLIAAIIIAVVALIIAA